MKQGLFDILENRPIADAVYKMRLCGDTSDVTRPGQFVNVLIDGFYLRRPISVCDKERDTLTLIYKAVGGGTAAMAELRGGRLDLLTGLGNGYDLELCGERPLLIGGGLGVPPLYWLAKELIKRGKSPAAALGFNTASEILLENEFKALGAETRIATADGSAGKKGFVTALLGGDFTDYCACGPEAMLRAAAGELEAPGQLSFEERMGCGFGACMGCSCRTKYGSKRICRDGPVLRSAEVIW